MIREEINLDWVKQLNIAIRYIEDHLTGTIEYDELAKMLCCSTYQFQRMFAFMNNVPLSEYIRRRKLSLAVADIQKGERVINVYLTTKLTHLCQKFYHGTCAIIYVRI